MLWSTLFAVNIQLIGQVDKKSSQIYKISEKLEQIVINYYQMSIVEKQLDNYSFITHGL